jgi:glycerate-2-kinase
MPSADFSTVASSSTSQIPGDDFSTLASSSTQWDSETALTDWSQTQ